MDDDELLNIGMESLPAHGNDPHLKPHNASEDESSDLGVSSSARINQQNLQVVS